MTWATRPAAAASGLVVCLSLTWSLLIATSDATLDVPQDDRRVCQFTASQWPTVAMPPSAASVIEDLVVPWEPCQMQGPLEPALLLHMTNRHNIIYNLGAFKVDAVLTRAFTVKIICGYRHGALSHAVGQRCCADA